MKICSCTVLLNLSIYTLLFALYGNYSNVLFYCIHISVNILLYIVQYMLSISLTYLLFYITISLTKFKINIFFASSATPNISFVWLSFLFPSHYYQNPSSIPPACRFFPKRHHMLRVTHFLLSISSQPGISVTSARE